MTPIEQITISGTVTGNDTAGSGLENVIITLASDEDTTETITNDSGEYIFPDVYINQTYTITATHLLYNRT